MGKLIQLAKCHVGNHNYDEPCQTFIKENFIVLELHNKFRLQVSYLH